MAKLSANGTVLVKVSRERNVAPERVGGIFWEREERAYMSNGRVLEKRSVRFEPGPFDNGKPQFHTWGWKWRTRVRPGITPDQLAEYFSGRGWKVTERVREGGILASRPIR